MRVSRSRGVRVWSIGDFEGKKPSQFGIAIREIPTGELCGPQVELVEDRCQTSGRVGNRHIGVPEDKELETFQVPNPGGNRDRSFRGRVVEICTIGESPDKE
jgi:hypothetical protein